MEFGRRIVMRPRVLEADGERDLRIVALVDFDTGCLAAERAAAVGGDDQRCAQFSAALERQRDGVVARCDGAHLVFDNVHVRKCRNPLLQRRHQMEVLNIVTEGIEIDFIRREFHLRRPPQPPGVVDDAHHPHWRRLRRTQRPNVQHLQGGNGTGKQSGGTVVGAGGALSHQHGGKAPAG